MYSADSNYESSGYSKGTYVEKPKWRFVLATMGAIFLPCGMKSKKERLYKSGELLFMKTADILLIR